MGRLSVSVAEEPKQDTAIINTALDAIRKELAAAQRQKTRLYELLELGEYDIPTFRERMEAVREKIAGLERREADTQRAIQDAAQADPASVAAKIRAVLAAYSTADAAGRNALLKSVIRVIHYRKEKKTKPTEFYLDIHLRPH